MDLIVLSPFLAAALETFCLVLAQLVHQRSHYDWNILVLVLHFSAVGDGLRDSS